MPSKATLRIAATLFLAAALSGSLYFVDTGSAEKSQGELAQRYLKQVLSQVEISVLRAQEESRRDPIGHAVSSFSQGVEPRVLRIQKVLLHSEPSPDPTALGGGNFELSRVIRPDDGAGVRVQLALGELGFLGAHSRISNDLCFLLVFAFFAALIWLATTDPSLPNTQAQAALLARLKTWTESFRAALTEMGIPLRDSLKNTQTILASVKQATWLGHKLRRGIHDQLDGLHRSRKDVAQTGRIAEEIITLANELITTHKAAAPQLVQQKLQQLLHLTHNLGALEQKNQVMIRKLEIQIEPWATDSDLLVAQLAALGKNTDELRHQVRDTTSKLMTQAQVFRDVKAEAIK